MNNHILLALILCATWSTTPVHARELAPQGTDQSPAPSGGDPKETSFRVDGEAVEGWVADFIADQPGLEKVYASRGLEVCLANAAGKNLDCVSDSDFKLGSGEFLLLSELTGVTFDKKKKVYVIEAVYIVDTMEGRSDQFTATCVAEGGKLACKK